MLHRTYVLSSIAEAFNLECDKLRSIFFINFIRLSYHKITNIQKKTHITIELGNAAQKGRYGRKTHGRYRPDEKKNAKI